MNVMFMFMSVTEIGNGMESSICSYQNICLVTESRVAFTPETIFA